MDPKKLALRCVAVAKAKKGQDILVLDIRGVSNFCDYFVIISATSLRQANAIAQAIEEGLSKDRIKTLSRVKSNDESGWIALDYSSVITHIFYKPMREFYSLERIWSEAKKVRVPPNGRKNPRLTHSSPK